jgi:Protein of unknown function (DUF2635)
MKVKPAAGLKIRDPKSLKVIPSQGFEIKTMTTYWARRIECKDVFVIDDEAEVSSDESLKPIQAGGANK